MELRISERKKAKIKLALQGSAGSGKTYSSLLLAKGLTGGDFTKIAIIDTENKSADLYAHLGSYNVVAMDAPYSPERYIEAIELCENAGMEVIILDSISNCWDYLLYVHSNMPGNSFANWGKITPRQNAFINKILQSDAHVIATMRVKQDYVLNQKNGKMVPEKVGLKAIQRNDLDYEFTIVFDIDITHSAKATKDRTGLFVNSPEFKISPNTGKKIKNGAVNCKGEVGNDQSTNNSSGFNAFPEATRINDGSFDSDGEGFDTIFWSSTVADLGSWYRALNYQSSSLGRGPSNNQSGFSVRFVRD